jgi:hypothetical protein
LESNLERGESTPSELTEGSIMSKKQHKLIERSIGANQKTFNLLGVPSNNGLGACYLQVYEKLVKAHGKREAIKQLKALYNEIVRFSCGLPVNPNTPIWCKRDKENFPLIFKPFKVFVRGGRLERRMALSILRSYESVILPAQPNLETVTSPSKGRSSFERIRPSFQNFLEKSYFVRKLQESFREKLDKSINGEISMPFHFSTKSGIKGPTVLTAGKQSVAIEEELAYLLSDFTSYFRKGNWIGIWRNNKKYFVDHEDIYRAKDDSNQTFLGRISFIPDKGGKTRTIAIGNYWVQDCLKGLHDALFGVLRDIPTDGTYDQVRQSDRVKTQSGVGAVWSYDLTAATDRFPIEPQIAVLKSIHPEIGSLWEKILKRMEFKYEDQIVRYEVGQPMGLYSSWAVFSVTHHVIIQYCAWLEREKFPFEKYAVLGDDVAIWSRGVAERYSRLLKDLDVSISVDKSFFPIDKDCLNKPCVAEFAKRIFVKGEEISAISPSIQYESWSAHWAIPEFVKYLEDHDLLRDTIPVSRLAKILGLTTKKLDELCCLFHIKQLLGTPLRVNLDSCKHSDLDLITKELVIMSRIDLLVEQSSDLWSQLADYMETTEQALENRLTGPIPWNLYFNYIISTRAEAALILEGRLLTLLPQESYTHGPISKPVIPEDISIQEIEYLPNVDTETILRELTHPVRHRVYRGKYIHNLMKKAKSIAKSIKG